jgi:DnaJ-class molecular chaperone
MPTDKEMLAEAAYIEWLKKWRRCIYCDRYGINEGADEEDLICKHCNGTGKTNKEAT